MKTARKTLLLSVLVLSGCDKFPHESAPQASRGLQSFSGDNYRPYRDPGAQHRERETAVGEYSRRDPYIQR
jgi:hypothetical protein